MTPSERVTKRWREHAVSDFLRTRKYPASLKTMQDYANRRLGTKEMLRKMETWAEEAD